jgi:prepilin-type processing-associated H-X9-DG protein
MRYRWIALPFLAIAAMVAAGQTSGTPEQTVRAFLSALDKADVKAASRLVENAKATDKLTQFEEMFQKGKMRFEVANMASTVTGNTAKVSFDLAVHSNGRAKKTPRQTISLRRSNGGVWRIVPPDRVVGPGKGQEMAAFAGMIANPSGAFKQATETGKSTRCLNNMSQVALACILYAADHNDRLTLSSSDFKSKVSPYVRNPSVFTCEASRKPYAFNDKLTGRKRSSIKNAARVVLAYEGARGVLDFRHEGKAAVAFVDGHCVFVTPKQAKLLVWK